MQVRVLTTNVIPLLLVYVRISKSPYVVSQKVVNIYLIWVSFWLSSLLLLCVGIQVRYPCSLSLAHQLLLCVCVCVHSNFLLRMIETQKAPLENNESCLCRPCPLFKVSILGIDSTRPPFEANDEIGLEYT